MHVQAAFSIHNLTSQLLHQHIHINPRNLQVKVMYHTRLCTLKQTGPWRQPASWMMHVSMMSHLMTSGKVSKEATICSLIAALARESSLKASAIMVMATIWLV